MGSGPIDGYSKPNQVNDDASIRHQKKLKDIEQLERVASGSISGDNLTVRSHSDHHILDGINAEVRPALPQPTIEPSIQNYQASLKQMEKSEPFHSSQVTQRIKNNSSADNASFIPTNTIKSMTATDSASVAKLADGTAVKSDFSQKTIQVSQDGHTVSLNLKPGQLSGSIDGKKFPFNENELGALSDFFQLMELFHQMGVEQRKVSRQARNITNQGVVQKIENQAEEQKKAALNNLVAGVVSSSAKMASAGLSMAGSVKGMKADAASAQAGNPPQSFQGQMISQKFQAFGTMFESSGDMAASGAKYQAAQHEAKQTVLRGGEEQLKHVKQTEQDQMQVAQDLLTKARETFAQVWQQMIQALQSQARNI